MATYLDIYLEPRLILGLVVKEHMNAQPAFYSTKE